MKSKKVVRFNIGKKLAQLHKVIELIKSQAEDRNYQILWLKGKYGAQIDLVREDYEDEMSSILEEYSCETSNINERIQKEYQNKHEMVENEMESYIANASINLRDFHKKESSDLSSMIKEVSTLTDAFNELLESFDKQCSEKKQQIRDKLSEMDVTYQREVIAHDAEAERRISALRQSSEEQIEMLKCQHESAKAAAMNSDWQNTFSESVRSIHADLMKRVTDLRETVEEGRQTMKEMISSGMNALNEDKEKFKRTIERSGDSEAEFRSVMEDLNAEMKLTAESNLQSIASLNKKKDEAAVKHKIELQRKLDEYKALVQQNQTRIIEKNEEIGRAFTDYEASIEAMSEKHRQEIVTVRKKHEKALNDASMVEDRLHRDLMYLEETQIKSIQSFKQQLSDEKASLKRKLENEEKLEQQDIEARKRAHEDELDKIRQDIIRLLNGGNEQEAMANIEIERLQRAKEQIISDSKNRMTEYELSHENELKELHRKNEEELASLNDRLDKSLAETESKNETEVVTLQSQLDQSYSQHSAELALKHSDTLSLIRLKNQDRREKDALEIELNEKYKQELEVLSKTREPSNERMMILDEMDQQIQQLASDLAALKASVEDQRSSITSKWQRSISSEASKSSNCEDSEDPCNWDDLNSIRSQISKVRDDYSTIVDLKSELARLKEYYARTLEALSVDLLRAKSTDEIDSKSSLVEEGTKSKWALMNDQRRRNKEEEEEFHKQITEEEAKYASEIAEIDQSIAKLQREFETQKKKTEEERDLLLVENKKKVQEENAKYEVARHDSIQQFKNQIIELKTQLEKLEVQRARQAKSFDERLESFVASSDHKVKSMLKKHAEDIGKLKSEQREKLALNDEAIQNLTEKRDNIKSKYEEMPSRECDLEEMRNLDSEARMRLDLVQKAVKDLQEYRWMMQAREKDYSSRFGKTTVGLYDARSRAKTPR